MVVSDGFGCIPGSKREGHLPDSNTKKRLLEVAFISKRRFLLFSQYSPPG
jgi:hypothetical protein